MVGTHPCVASVTFVPKVDKICSEAAQFLTGCKLIFTVRKNSDQVELMMIQLGGSGVMVGNAS